MKLRYTLPLLLAAALGACGGDDDSPAGGTRSAGTGETYGGGPAGGMLVVLSDREPDELNPLTYDSNPAFQAVRLMFRALARRDSTLSGYQPDLARSWELRPDSTLVVHLRNDVNWHDGRRVTSEDVLFTLDRQRDPETASPRQGELTAVVGATAPDSFTVEVKLSQTGPYTVNTVLELVPVPKHLLESVAPAAMRTSSDFGRNPVGNGFYRFERWDAGQNLVLVVNPDHPEGRAAIDRIVMRFVPDMNAALTELLAGQADLLKVTPDQRERVGNSDVARLYRAPRVRPAWIAWNTRRAPLDDVSVRRAILMAVDRPTLARGLFGEIGEAALSPIPAALREHSPGVTPLPFNLQQAQQLLAQAGWRDTNGDGVVDRGGRPLSIEVDYISTDLIRQDVLVAMQSMVAKIGVRIVPRPYESTAWVDRLRAREFQGSLWGWGWGPGVAGPNAELVFHTRSIPPNGPNFASYSNPRVDALIDSTQVVSDTTRARQVWRALEQELINDAVYAPLYLDPELFAVGARFQNVKFRGIEWWEDVPYWSIPEDQRLPRDRTQ